MSRRAAVLPASLAILAAGVLLVARPRSPSATAPTTSPSLPGGSRDRVAKTDEEWKKVLTPEQFDVTRRKGTERAFTGPNWDNHAKGTYRCVCCDLPLFSSETKFDSGTGWPSFWRPVSSDAVREAGPREAMLVPSLESVRSVHGAEVLCARCDAHLGDVFDDGPKPTGLRYCMNGTAMKFVPAK